MQTVNAEAEAAIRQAMNDALIAELLPRLGAAGWAFGVQDSHGARSLLANKGTGRLYLPGGRGGKWHTQVAEIRVDDTTDEEVRGLLPEVDEVPVWRVELEQSAPLHVVMMVAEQAAGGAGVLAG